MKTGKQIIQIPGGGGGGGATNLAFTPSSTDGIVTSDTGTDATIPLGNGTNSGLSLNDYTTAEKNKLAGIATGATAYTDELAQDAVGGILVDSSEIDFTYNDATPSITASIVAGSIDETKLDTSVNASLDLADTASQPGHIHTLANVTDVTMTVANLNSLDDGVNSTLHFHNTDRDRANHTGTQASTTISDFTEASQDSVGVMVDSTLTYNDATPSLGRSALTGAITASAGSNTTALGSFTKSQLNVAVSDGDVLYVGDVTSNATHTGEVTGSTALTVDPTAISNKAAKTSLAGTEEFLINDAGTLKKVTASNLPTGGSTNLTYTASTRLLESSTGTDVTLPLFNSTEAGLTPLSGGGTSNFLRADGTWAAPSGGGGVSDGDKGDITVSSSGTVWTIDEPALRKSETSVNNSPLFYTINKFDTLQTNFYGNGTVALDTTVKAEGTGCMKLTLATAGVCGPRLALAATTNFYQKAFTIKCRASAWANISTAEILFATEAGFTNYYLWQWKGGTNGKLVSPPDGEWIERVFNPGDCTVGAGTPNWGAITHIIIRAQASSGTPDLYVDDFKYFNATQKPMVCVTFDDSISTQFSNGKAKLDQYDIKATFYSIWDLIGTGGYLTQTEIDTLSVQGHDISGHGQTNLTTLTSAQQITDLIGMKKWLVTNGYRGTNNYALPNGAYTDAVLANVRKYFNSIANIDWLSNTKEYSPNYLINRFSPDSSTSTATIQAWIDNAIANNNMCIIAFHGIVASGATGAQVNQSTYDTIMDYIGTKKNAGIINTGTLTDYYASPLFGMKQKGGRNAPSYLSSELKQMSLQEALFEIQPAIWQATGMGSSTVPGVFGMPALTVVGTATARSFNVTNYYTRTKKIGYVSAAAAGSLTGPRNAQQCISVGNGSGLGGFYNVIRFACSDAATVAGARQFVGISATTTALTNVEPSTLVNCVGVGHGTADTNLKLFYGGSAAQTPIDLGANFPANTLSTDVYELVLWAPSNDTNSVIYWEVTRLNTGHFARGVLNGTIGTTRPATTTLMTNFQSMRTNNATALAVGLDIALIYTQTNYV